MSTNRTFNKVQLDVKFTQASSRANLISEENISISFGKISKYFADLHSQAFTGYTHPSHTAHSSGLYKITVDGLGHVSAATAATKADIPALDYLPNTTKYALSDSVGGSAKTADKLTTARTIAIGTGVTSTATSFDGSANITIPVTGIKEAYLTWGGKDFTQSYSPLDAALEPRLGANRLEMCPGSGIKIERTTDGGTTWTEVSTSSISNAQRSTLFSSSSGYSVPVSATSTAGMGTDAAKYMMRITLDTSVANVYTSLLKFILNISTNGCANCYVKLRIRTAANVTAGNDTWLTWDKTNKAWSSSPTEANTKCPIGGWSGYNVINVAAFTTYGNNTSQYRNVQFIFGCSKNDSTSSGLSIINIQGYGGVAWNAPSNMARTGHLYSWNGTGAATFPSSVTATNFTGKINTMTITGTTSGSYDLNTFLTEHPTIPTSTDTTSTASPAHGGTFTTVDTVTRDEYGHVTKINTKTVTLPADSNTDTKVTQSSSTTANYRPLVLGAKNSSTVSELSQTVTDQTYTTTNMYAQPSTGTIFASLFNGVIYKSGGQWITARDNAPVYANKGAATGGSYYPAFFAKSKTGGWSMGVLGNSDTFYATFTTDENYSASPQSNTNTYQITFPSKSGTIALTSDLSGYLPLAGGTMTGVLTLKGEQYNDNYAMDCNNSNIIHINALRFNDNSESYTEGISFPRTTSGYWDTIWAKGGEFYFTPNHETDVTGATSYKVLHTNNTSFSSSLSSGTKIGTITIAGTATDLYCQTNTDTKVTSAANHYTPATASGSDKTASASGATAAWSIDVVKGVTLNTDGKGHVTGMSVTSGKIPANPIPSNNVTGSGTSGYLAKWNGANTITNGPQLGSSTTTFLRNDGSWATPTDTDEKVKVDLFTSTTATDYMIAGATSAMATTAAHLVIDTADGVAGARIRLQKGTTSAVGQAMLMLGNNIASGTTKNMQGSILMYASTTKYGKITQAALTDDRTWTMPDKTGTVALTSDIPTVPTVNNASLTLKGAGTTVTTFTANSSTNQSLDIVAGTNVTITPDATNHKITIASSYTNTDTKVNVTLGTTTKAYLLGTSTAPTSTAQAVTSVADTGVYLGTTAGSLYATTFYGSLSGTATYANELNMKTLTVDTLDTTPGSYVFKGENLFGGVFDWTGLQIDASNDRFQIVANDQLMFRQNDNASITSSWKNWLGCLTPSNVTGSGGITVTQNDTTIGSGDTAFKYKGSVTISHSNSITASTSTVFKKFSYDANGHITGTANVTASDIPSLNYIPNTQAGLNAAINLLSTGSANPTLADYYIAQYAGGGETTTSYHRRPISALWNTFKGLITLATTGSGNAVTAVSIANDGDNNRKITVTKGSTFSLSTHNHDSNYVKTFLSTNYDISQAGYYAVMVNKNTDNPDIDLPTSSQWWHVLSMSWAGTSGDVNNWISQLAIPTYQSKSKGLYWRTNSAASTAMTADDWKRVYCEEKLTPSTTTKTRNILHLYGETVGNTASDLISGTAGVLSYGDAGPQINFSTAATIGSAQDSAIIWTDNDTAATGVSWHFVSNQSDWNVISKRFHARTSISIGTELPNKTYNLYVNGTTFHSDGITFGSTTTSVSPALSVYTRTTSTYNSLVKWSNGSTWGTRGAEIGYHNTGGDTTDPGTICILPYQTTAQPWDGQVGLFIKKDHVYIDGVELSKSGHTHSYIPMSGSTSVTGDIGISKTSGDTGFYAKRSDTGVEVWMGVGSSGTNHGVYSKKLGKWLVYGDATNVYLNGNATTASSWATARTLTLSGQLTGSVSVKGDANMTLSGYLKRSFLVDDTSDFASYAWHKFAEITVTGTHEDRSITFIVSKTWGAVPGFSGILTAHIRTGSTKVYEDSQFQWNLAGTSINPEDFVLVYTNTANTSCKVELWYKQTTRYDGWIFTVLKEHNRLGIENAWTVYSASGHGSATYTAGTDAIASTIADIKNSSNDVNVTQTSVGSTYTNYRPLLIGDSSSGTAGFTPTTTTAGTYATAGIYCQPSSGKVYASEFITNTYLSASGSSLATNGLFLKSYFKCADTSQTVLQYSGYGVRTYSGKITSADGLLVAVGCGGLTILGGGESANNLAALISDDQKISGKTTLNVGGTLNTSFTGNTEAAIVSSDGSIYLITNCQTIGNRKPVCLDTSSNFYPGTTKTGSIGTSTYMWNTIYGATIYENGTSLQTKYGLNNQIYALGSTSSTAQFNGSETLITSLPNSSGTSTPAYQRTTLDNFIKNAIGIRKEPVLYNNSTNPTQSATVNFDTNLGTPKYLKLFISVQGASSYSSGTGVTNIIDIDPLQYSNGAMLSSGSPGQYGVGTYLTAVCVLHSEPAGGGHTYSLVKGVSLSLAADNTPQSITQNVYLTKIIAVY